jgi:hypothetical protein
MTYKNAMKRKIARIEKTFKYEIRSGKCTKEDIDFILDTLKGTLEPWKEEQPLTPAQIDAEVEMHILRMKEDPF